MTDTDNSDAERSRAHEELRLLYQVTTQDLAFFKRQQWTITNYLLAVDAALIAIPQSLKTGINCCQRIVLCVIATVLAILGIYILWKLEKSIKTRRDRLTNIRRLFTKTFCLARRSKNKEEDSAVMAILLTIIMAAGAVVVWWLVCEHCFIHNPDEIAQKFSKNGLCIP